VPGFTSRIIISELDFRLVLDFEFFVLLYSDEFAAGFGSHTPMILGQAKVVRYFPNYER